jgi:tagatose 6-phosphate kinase
MPPPPSSFPARLLAIGLNPAWQKTLFFDHLEFGEVNRAARVDAQASGKGINFIHAVRQAGGAAVVLQVAGGVTGDWLVADLDRRGLAHATVAVAGATRVCNTLLCHATGQMTELIEPSAELTPAEIAGLEARLAARLPEVAGLALCGTFPPGVPPAFYAGAARAARARGLPVLLDGVRGVLPTLEAGVDLLKINASELAGLAETTADAPPAAAAVVLKRFPKLDRLAVTAGPRTAFLFDRRHAWALRLPPLPAAVVNPIGAGDTTGGVLLAQIVNRRQLFADAAAPATDATDSAWLAWAFRDALACASASCLTAAPAVFDLATARALAAATVVTRQPL